VEVILDPDLCQNETRERGGSLFCPMVEAVSYEPAYQITYSYLGPPLASHECAGQRFTFSFFFRPEELDGSEPGSFASDNGAAAESLRVAISRESRQGFVIDEKSSTLCPGYYADGEWVYEDSACREKLVLNTVTVPSDYVTIGIESLQGRVSIRSQRFL
jgi:hypothetical protein